MFLFKDSREIIAGKLRALIRKVGDYIGGAGAAGAVEQIQVFTTALITVDNKVVIIPNPKMMGDNIINYSAKDTRRVDLTFSVSYKDNLDNVRGILQGIVYSDPRILKEPECAILVMDPAA